jgi:hypothetical protein
MLTINDYGFNFGSSLLSLLGCVFCAPCVCYNTLNQQYEEHKEHEQALVQQGEQGEPHDAKTPMSLVAFAEMSRAKSPTHAIYDI